MRICNRGVLSFQRWHPLLTDIEIYLLIEWFMIKHIDSSFSNTVAVTYKCFKGGCSHILYICCCQEGTRACWTASSAAGQWKTSVNTCHLSTTSVAALSIATSLLSNSECACAALGKCPIIVSLYWAHTVSYLWIRVNLMSGWHWLSIAWLTVVSLFFSSLN